MKNIPRNEAIAKLLLKFIPCLLIIGFISSISSNGFSQQIHREVVYSGGETFVNTAFSLSYVIGEGNIVSGDFTDINWDEGLFYLSIAMDATVGTSYSAMGTRPLSSVPYSLDNNSIYINTVYKGDQYLVITGSDGPPAGTISDYNLNETIVIGTQT